MSLTDLVLTLVLVVLVVNLLACLVRVLGGPTGRYRLLGVVLAGTTGAAVLLVTSVLVDVPPLRDAALVLVALATVVVVTRVGLEREVGP